MADLTVAVYPDRPDDGSAHYRMVLPSRALAMEPGLRVLRGAAAPTPVIGWSLRFPGAFPPPGVRALAVKPLDVDVVVIQRPLHHWWPDLVPLIQATGTAVVVDLDDDFSCIDPNNVAYEPCNHPGRNWHFLAKTCLAADLVTTTTPALARRFAPHGRFRVLPNVVPEAYLHTTGTRDPSVVTVGWSGSVETHPGDLDVTHGAVARSVEAHGARMAVVGTGAGVQAGLGLSEPPVACGWVPLSTYPSAVASFDIGIVPLRDTEFSRAKSSLKMSEMASLGVPPVVSPTDDNLRTHRLGVGVVAARPREWGREVRRLLTDDVYRSDLAASSRAAMASQTVEGNAWRWAEAWVDAYRNRIERMETAA